MTRHEFVGPAWIGMARERITAALAGEDLDGVTFSLCEEFTDPPSHLRRPGAGTIGFCLRIAGGRVEVDDRPGTDVDLRVVSDYADALAVARDPDAAAADPAEAERRMRAGRLAVHGDPSRMPPALAALDLHRMLAEGTR